MQAAWIVDDSDVDYTDSDDNEHDAMVLEGSENGLPAKEYGNGFEPDGDDAYLPRDYDDETETDSVMMVSI